MANYRKQAKRLYPDSDGINHIPLNMGEFGISGGGNFAKNFECGETTVLPSAKMKAEWAYKTVVAAEDNNMSWHYWGFTKVGGFEAYDRNNDTWYEGFPQSLIIN